MQELTQNFKNQWQRIINEFKLEIASLRTSRVSPALAEDIRVESYNSSFALKEVASISAPAPNLLVIDPWDKNLIPAIQKSIEAAELGVTPSNDGQYVRLVFPPLTEEKRQALIKVLKQKSEQTKIRFRQERDGVKKQIQEMFDKKEVGEDEKFQLSEELQKQVDEFNAELEKIGRDKETEIMRI